jgi:hypothetical protein
MDILTVPDSPGEFIDGKCERFLFSRKGGIDGVMLRIKGGDLVQIAMHAPVGALMARFAQPGKRLRLLATPDRSVKVARSPHRVYAFTSFAAADGKAIESKQVCPADVRIGGIVAALHFARHGQPNGVVLESGEFIHLRPRGMLQAAPVVGAAVTAVGQLRITLLGTRMLEAHQLNGLKLN